jgi:hypothetical protein
MPSPVRRRLKSRLKGRRHGAYAMRIDQPSAYADGVVVGVFGVWNIA